jgi:titin
LSWVDNATNETGYLVERAPDNAGVPGTFAQIATRGVSVTTYTNTGLASSTTYWYRVRASGTVNSDYSNIVSGTTLMAIPAAPSNLVATAVAGHEIDLSWTDNATNETSYTVQRAPDNGGVAGSYSNVATLGANATSYANLNVAANTRYWYRVRASNAGGNSAWVVTSVTSLAEAPLAPTALTATRTASALTATLAWTDNSSDETGFAIEQAPDNGGAPGTFAQVGTVAANVKTFTASGLTGATKYWFRVGSNNAYGTAYSNNASVTTALPTNLSVTSSLVSGVLRANLTWTAGTGARVDVYRDGVKIKANISNTGATTDSNRTVGTTNVYQVCNVNLTGAAQCSNSFSITF